MKWWPGVSKTHSGQRWPIAPLCQKINKQTNTNKQQKCARRYAPLDGHDVQARVRRGLTMFLRWLQRLVGSHGIGLAALACQISGVCREAPVEVSGSGVAAGRRTDSQQGASQKISRRASGSPIPSHHAPARRSRSTRGTLLPAAHRPLIALSCSTLASRPIAPAVTARLPHRARLLLLFCDVDARIPWSRLPPLRPTSS